jgi:hypothetical protein
MKKVIFLLLAVFALSFVTIEAKAETTDKRPKRGYNYQKQRTKQNRHNFFFKKRIQRQNGGCGWMRNH